jgi:polyhydroxybutyrate depolymerase
VDDVAFLDALLDDLAGAYRVDPRRVFATGMSNGAMMAYRLASELSERIAAVAPVAGTMATEG